MCFTWASVRWYSPACSAWGASSIPPGARRVTITEGSARTPDSKTTTRSDASHVAGQSVARQVADPLAAEPDAEELPGALVETGQVPREAARAHRGPASR
jgi:hypothetical protein